MGEGIFHKYRWQTGEVVVESPHYICAYCDKYYVMVAQDS